MGVPKYIREVPRPTNTIVIDNGKDGPTRYAVRERSGVQYVSGGNPQPKNGKVVGVFTVTDLIQAIAEDNDEATVGDLMSTKVIIINENLKIAKAIEILFKKSISRLIIADNDNNLLGIVTRTDLINSITNFEQFPIFTN